MLDALIDSLLAFAMGGAICAAVQIAIDRTSLTPTRILVGLVVIGAFIGSVGLYEPLRNIFGCGISVPLLGFGASVISGVRDAVDSDGFTGIFTGPFSAMGAGTVLSLCLGLLASVFIRGNTKKL